MNTTKEAVNQPVSKLPKFTEDISITITVQSIYEKMLEQLPNDYKHREIVAHAIIGSAANLSFIYNALNGYTNDIDFEVGEVVRCTDEDKNVRYDANKQDKDGNSIPQDAPMGPDYKPDWKTREVAIGDCVITEINMYSKDKLRVEFMSFNSYRPNNPAEKKTIWVNHKKCTKIGLRVENTDWLIGK